MPNEGRVYFALHGSDFVRIPVDLGGCSGVIRARVPVDLGAIGAKRRALSGVGAKRRVKAHAEG